MYKILKAEELTTNIFLMVVEAKRVAKHCLPGQFLIVRTAEDSERIPLTISDFDKEKGEVKKEIVKYLEEKFNKSISETTSPFESKFNIFIWSPRKEGKKWSWKSTK